MERERQHRRHCDSLQLLSSDTRLIVHLSTTALSAARQLARSPCWPACLPACLPTHPLSTFIISQPGLPEPARSSDSRRGREKVYTALQMSFPNTIKLLTHLALLAVFDPCYVLLVRSHLFRENKSNLRHASNVICQFNDCLSLLMWRAGLEMAKGVLVGGSE